MHLNDSTVDLPEQYVGGKSGLSVSSDLTDLRFKGHVFSSAGRPNLLRVKSMFVSPTDAPTKPSSPSKGHNPSDKADQTMNFSTLLIAKPM